MAVNNNSLFYQWIYGFIIKTLIDRLTSRADYKNKNQLIFFKRSDVSCLTDKLICIFSGPEKWHEKFPLANGVRQSPVNIITSKTQQSTDLTVNPLRWTYVPENVKCLVNPGYCWRVDVNGKGSELTGGPLKNDIYLVEQFHCHWGWVVARIYYTFTKRIKMKKNFMIKFGHLGNFWNKL